MAGVGVDPLEVRGIIQVGDAQLPDRALVHSSLKRPPDLEGLLAGAERGVQHQRVDVGGAEVLERLLYGLGGLWVAVGIRQGKKGKMVSEGEASGGGAGWTGGRGRGRRGRTRRCTGEVFPEKDVENQTVVPLEVTGAQGWRAKDGAEFGIEVGANLPGRGEGRVVGDGGCVLAGDRCVLCLQPEGLAGDAVFLPQAPQSNADEVLAVVLWLAGGVDSSEACQHRLNSTAECGGHFCVSGMQRGSGCALEDVT